MKSSSRWMGVSLRVRLWPLRRIATILGLSLALGAMSSTARAQRPSGVLVSVQTTVCPSSWHHPGPVAYQGKYFDFWWTATSRVPFGTGMYIGPFITTSIDGTTRWNNPQMFARCTIEEWLQGVTTWYYFHLAATYSGSIEPVASTGCDVTQVTYDPYSEDGDETCAEGGSGGGSPPPGSGIPYSPGDHTGGETVDWNTGIGNGGSSTCGADAVVEYICIEISLDGITNWASWACGYATTC